MTYELILLEWNNVTIELTYRPQWSKAIEGMAHLAIQTIQPCNAALPITETGYRSHFFKCDETLTEQELKTLVRDWLDKEAQSPEWQKKQQEQMQLTLF